MNQSNETSASQKETIIKPNTSWLHIDIAGLIAYRDLITLLVRRDFVARYKQTILGPIWFVVNPIVTTLVFTLIFNKVIGVSTEGVPPVLFYMSGMLGWNYFSSVLGSTANSLAGNTHLFSKVYFPRLIPPFASSISAAFSVFIQLITFLCFYAQHKLGAQGESLAAPTLQWLLFIPLCLHMGSLALGCGLILSSLTAKYRDVAYIQGFVVSMLMYATPVIYPLSKIPEKYQWIANINPMTAVVEATRHIFLQVGTVSSADYLQSLGISITLLFVGIFLYQRAARTFVDTV